MSRRVVFSPESEEQLAELYRYIAAAASPETAARYTEAIISYCEDLRMFPGAALCAGIFGRNYENILHDDAGE